MSHTRSFEKALAVIPETSHSYSANLSPSWAVGDVPHGGHLAALLYRLTKTHFSTTHPERHGGRGEPVNMQLTFVRRCQVGAAWLDVKDGKLGTATSVIRVVLSQEGRDGTRIEKLVGNITVMNVRDEKGLSMDSGWRPQLNGPIHGPPGIDTAPGSKPGKEASDTPWLRTHMPHPHFRKAPAHVEVYGPGSQTARPPPGTEDQWARLRWGEGEEVVQGRWTTEAAVFLLDIFPAPLARLERKINEGKAAPVPVWFPTLAMSIDFKKPLPEGGVEWLFSRVTAKSIQNGRMDVEIVLLDSSGELVALASHANLMLDLSRNRARI